MEEENFELLKQRQTANEQFDLIQKFHLAVFFTATFISVAIIMIEGIYQLVEVNLFNYFLILTLSMLPTLIFAINILIYLLPIIPFKRNEKGMSLDVDYSYIVKEQKKPTTAKYKVRKVFLTVLCILGILST